MRIVALDHLVLTVADLTSTISFYHEVLGMQVVRFEGDRVALIFGNQKINVHQAGAEVQPNARHATPGSADLCFLTDLAIESAMEILEEHGVPIELGPVKRTGAMTGLISVYFRDPDGNLIEVSNPT